MGKRVNIRNSMVFLLARGSRTKEMNLGFFCLSYYSIGFRTVVIGMNNVPDNPYCMDGYGDGDGDGARYEQ